MELKTNFELNTERLVLRSRVIEDAPSLLHYASNSRVAQAAGWLPHSSLTMSQRIITTVLQTDMTFAIALKTNTKNPIGAIRLSNPTENEVLVKATDADLGYWLAEEFWGQGIMTEALIAVIDLAIKKMKITNVWCSHFANNIRAQQLERRLGFQHVYTEYDVINTRTRMHHNSHYARMTAKEWLASIQPPTIENKYLLGK